MRQQWKDVDEWFGWFKQHLADNDIQIQFRAMGAAVVYKGKVIRVCIKSLGRAISLAESLAPHAEKEESQ